MAHPKDGEQIPIGSRVYSKKSNVKGTIVGHNFVKDGKQFLNYYMEIDGQPGKMWAAYHDDLFVISLPPGL